MTREGSFRDEFPPRKRFVFPRCACFRLSGDVAGGRALFLADHEKRGGRPYGVNGRERDGSCPNAGQSKKCSLHPSLDPLHSAESAPVAPYDRESAAALEPVGPDGASSSKTEASIGLDA
jgi:hypothetical protein